MADERLPTGVKELDSLLEGGIPKGLNILVKGMTGTGKTTFALQFLVNGARNGEKCMYLTFEESADQIVRYGSKFFPDLKKHIDNGLIQILDFSPHTKIRDNVRIIEGQRVEIPSKDDVDSVSYIQNKILDIRGQTIQRVVIDSLQTFATTFVDLSGKSDPEDLRRTLSKILVLLKKEGIITYILSEESEEQPDKFGFTSFTVDGIFVFKVNEALDLRTLKISKMRGTKHTLKPLSIKLAEGEGIVMTEQKHGT